MSAETIELLPILIAPDPALRIRAHPVSRKDDDTLRDLLPRMFATMYRAPGIGLAAPQVEVGLRVAVVDLMPDDKPAPITLINPELVAHSDELADSGGGLPFASRPVRRRDPPGAGEGAIPGPGRSEAGDRGRGSARRLPPARDRSSRWRAIRGSPFQSEAQHDHAAVSEGDAAEARRRGPQSLMRLAFLGSPAFAVPVLLAPSSGRARDRRRLLPAAPPGGPGPGGSPLPGSRRGPAARDSGANPHPAANRFGCTGGVLFSRSRRGCGRRVWPYSAARHARRPPARLP